MRGLNAREIGLLAPYIPTEDLHNARLHARVPWYLPKRFGAIVRGNRIYFRPGVYGSGSVQELALLGHELVHVGQYRQGMTALRYLWSALGGYRKSRYERAAHELQARLLRELPRRISATIA